MSTQAPADCYLVRYSRAAVKPKGLELGRATRGYWLATRRGRDARIPIMYWIFATYFPNTTCGSPMGVIAGKFLINVR